MHDSLRSLEELFEILVSPDLVFSNLDINFYRYFEDTAVFLEGEILKRKILIFLLFLSS